LIAAPEGCSQRLCEVFVGRMLPGNPCWRTPPRPAMLFRESGDFIVVVEPGVVHHVETRALRKSDV